MALGMGFPSEGEPNNGWKLYVTTLVMTIMAGLFTIARFAARISKYRLGADDWTTAGALFFSVITAIAIFSAIEHGYGKHIDDLSAEQSQTALRWFFIAQTPYKVTVCLNKVSAILLYQRIFAQREYQIACLTLLCVVVGWSASTIFATIFQCLPIEASWTDDEGAACIDKGAFWIAYAVGNILTDVLVLVLPIRPVFKLNMKLEQRLLICGVFLLGGFVTITSILRTTAVSNSLENKEDITYNFVTRGIWTLVEANAGIICACLPVLKSPVARIIPWIFRNPTTNSRTECTDPSGDRRQYRLNALSNPWQEAMDGKGGSEGFHNVYATSAAVKTSRDSDEEVMLKAESFAPSETHCNESGGIRKQSHFSVQREQIL